MPYLGFLSAIQVIMVVCNVKLLCNLADVDRGAALCYVNI